MTTIVLVGTRVLMVEHQDRAYLEVVIAASNLAGASGKVHWSMRGLAQDGDVAPCY